MSITARDQKHVWHPYTQHKITEAPFTITRGEGAYLFDENGKRYLDLISSWMVNLHGHCHPVIAKAIYEQAMQLEQVIFSGFTHEPAVKLAEELLTILPNEFTKVFYSDNGSTAVEVALKMAYQYWRNIGESQRKRFIAFEQSYHGDTFGAMSVGTCGFFKNFEDLFFEIKTFEFPATWTQDENVVIKEQAIIKKMADYLEQFGHEIAGIIIEPLVQGSGGMHMCRLEFLRELERLMRSYGVLIIYDEVMTGFGRTGEYFSCNKANTTPDIICMAKGITGGFLPIAVTACHERIYEAFLGENFAKALAHGHSYTANPLGCAAGLASLQLLKDPKTIMQISTIEKVHRESLTHLATEIPIEHARYVGTIAAFDLKLEMEYGSSASLKIRQSFVEQGLLIRPFGKIVWLMPPYCTTEHELRSAYEIVAEAIQGVIA